MREVESNYNEPHFQEGPCQLALKAIEKRGASRDMPKGERSMARTVAIFKAYTGIELSEAEGWRFMQSLKLARSAQGAHIQDDLVDLCGYTELLDECLKD